MTREWFFYNCKVPITRINFRVSYHFIHQTILIAWFNIEFYKVYSRQLGTNFWYEFDNFFLWDQRQDVLKALGNISDLDRICKEHKINETYPIDFINEVRQDEQRVNGVIFLAQKQLDIMNNCFGNDIESNREHLKILDKVFFLMTGILDL